MKQEPIFGEGYKDKEPVLERLKLKKWKASIRNWVWKMKWRQGVRHSSIFCLSRLGELRSALQRKEQVGRREDEDGSLEVQLQQCFMVCATFRWC